MKKGSPAGPLLSQPRTWDEIAAGHLVIAQESRGEPLASLILKFEAK
jgi:hypothetical protein